VDPLAGDSRGELVASCSNCCIARLVLIANSVVGLEEQGSVSDFVLRRKGLLYDYLGNSDVACNLVESAVALRESGDIRASLAAFVSARQIDCSIAMLGWYSADVGQGMSGTCAGFQDRKILRAVRQSFVRERLEYAWDLLAKSSLGFSDGSESYAELMRDLLRLRSLLYDCHALGLVPQQRRALAMMKKADALVEALRSAACSASGVIEGELGSALPIPRAGKRGRRAGPKRSQDGATRDRKAGRRNGAAALGHEGPAGAAQGRRPRGRGQTAPRPRGSSNAKPGVREPRVSSSLLRTLKKVESLIAEQRIVSAHQELRRLQGSGKLVIKSLPVSVRKRLASAEDSIEVYMQSLSSARRAAEEPGSTGCSAFVAVAIMMFATICYLCRM
jgi:hypothetical protein